MKNRKFSSIFLLKVKIHGNNIEIKNFKAYNSEFDNLNIFTRLEQAMERGELAKLDMSQKVLDSLAEKYENKS